MKTPNMLLLLPLLPLLACGRISPTKMLKDHLLTGYDKTLPPIASTSDLDESVEHSDDEAALLVAMTWRNLTLNDVNEKTWTSSMTIIANMSWTDDRLVWDPANHSDIEWFVVKGKELFLPSIECVKCLNPTQLLSDTSKLKVFSNGRVEASAQANLELRCEIFTARFPFDNQYCYPGFVHDQGILDDDGSYDAIYFKGSAGWDLNLYLLERQNSGNDTLAFKIELNRPFFYWLFLIMFSMCFITIIFIHGAFMAKSDGIVEYVTATGITTLTGLFIGVTSISDKLPPSRGLPGLGWTVFGYFVIVFLATMTSIGRVYLKQWLNTRYQATLAEHRPRWLVLGVSITGHHALKKTLAAIYIVASIFILFLPLFF